MYADEVNQLMLNLNDIFGSPVYSIYIYRD